LRPLKSKSAITTILGAGRDSGGRR
jgi:hypothetical protein